MKNPPNVMLSEPYPPLTLLPWYRNTRFAQGATRSFGLVVGHFALATEDALKLCPVGFYIVFYDIFFTLRCNHTMRGKRVLWWDIMEVKRGYHLGYKWDNVVNVPQLSLMFEYVLGISVYPWALYPSNWDNAKWLPNGWLMGTFIELGLPHYYVWL